MVRRRPSWTRTTLQHRRFRARRPTIDHIQHQRHLGPQITLTRGFAVMHTGLGPSAGERALRCISTLLSTLRHCRSALHCITQVTGRYSVDAKTCGAGIEMFVLQTNLNVSPIQFDSVRIESKFCPLSPAIRNMHTPITSPRSLSISSLKPDQDINANAEMQDMYGAIPSPR